MNFLVEPHMLMAGAAGSAAECTLTCSLTCNLDGNCSGLNCGLILKPPPKEVAPATSTPEA